MNATDFLEACKSGTFHANILNDDLNAETRAQGLRSAALTGHLEVVRRLLDLDPSIRVDYHTAADAAFGGLPVYKFLHSRHPDVIHWSFEISGCAVNVACRSRNMDLLRYVLGNDADPGRRVDTPYVAFYIHPPMDAAVWNDDEEALRLLVKYGATFRGRGALRDAAQFNRMKAARCLVELGHDVNYICYFDVPYFDVCRHCTASLHAAAAEGHVEMVQFLLEKGGDPRLVDPHGKTAFDVAYEKGMWEVLELLEEWDEWKRTGVYQRSRL